MSLIGLVLTLVVVGVLLWLLNNYVPMDGKIKRIINVVVVIVVTTVLPPVVTVVTIVVVACAPKGAAPAVKAAVAAPSVISTAKAAPQTAYFLYSLLIHPLLVFLTRRGLPDFRIPMPGQGEARAPSGLEWAFPPVQRAPGTCETTPPGRRGSRR